MQQQSWGFVQHQKSYILCNTEVLVQHGSTSATRKSTIFAIRNFSIFYNKKGFVAKNVKISDCKNGGLPCCTSVLHKMSDFGVAQNLNFVVALVIAAHKFLLNAFEIL